MTGQLTARLAAHNGRAWWFLKQVNVKLKYWCGFPGIFGLEGAPVLEFAGLPEQRPAKKKPA